MGLLNESLAERVLREREMMWDEHRSWEPLWQEITALICPKRGDILVHTTPGTSRTRRLFDSTALVAATRLSAAMAGVVTPTTIQWFDFELQKQVGRLVPKQAEAWASGSARTMFELMQKTNFDSEVQSMYHDLVTYGTGAMFIINDGGAPNYRCLHPSEYAIWTDSNGRVVKMVRDIYMTIREAMKTFGVENLSPDMIRKISLGDDIDEKSYFAHWIAFADDEVVGFPSDNFPVASVYVDVDAKHVVKRSGFEEWPCPIVRWSVASGESYGYAPSFDALPDVASLNKAEEYALRAWAMAVMPPLLAIHDGILGKPDLRPSRMTFVNQEGALKWFPPGTDLNIETVKREDKRRSIWNTFFMDQVQFVPERGKTPPSAEEVRARLNIMLQILGPTLSRAEFEFMLPMLNRTYGIYTRSDKLPVAPSAAIQYAQATGQELNVQFVGPIARAKRSAESQKLDMAIQSLGIAREVDPNALDVVNVDEWLREKYRIEMVPSQLLRSRDDVNMRREQRAQQQQEQMEMQRQAEAAQNAGAAAPAIKEANAQLAQR